MNRELMLKTFSLLTAYREFTGDSRIANMCSEVIDAIDAELAKPEQVSGDTSDGYHTFNELYDFRKAYNAALFNEWAQNNKYSVHKSKRHFDGGDCFGGGWFIVVAQLPDGQISNHYEMKDWDKFLLPETDKALFEYDNHTGADVLQRLFSLRPPEVANEFYPDWDMLQPYHERIAELEAQLAQPEQEPVAWAVLRPDGRVKLLSHQQGVEVDLKWAPLYTKEKT
jgi:hypothetical protein